MILIFTAPWDCEQPDKYDAATTPVPRVGEVVLVWADLAQRTYVHSPELPRQVRCVVSSVEYNLTAQVINVLLVDE
jgi:hypothetical protein